MRQVRGRAFFFVYKEIMISETLKPIELTFGGKTFVFHQRMATVAEEDAIDQRFAEINKKDPARYEIAFQLCRDVLAETAASMPEAIVDDEEKPGEQKSVPLGDGSVSAALAAAFAERTMVNERIIRTAYNLYRGQLVPDYRFL